MLICNFSYCILSFKSLKRFLSHYIYLCKHLGSCQHNKASYEYADDEDGEHDDDGDYEPRIIPAKPANMPPLMVQEHVPDQEQNPFVGDSQEGIEYVSGFYSKI